MQQVEWLLGAFRLFVIDPRFANGHIIVEMEKRKKGEIVVGTWLHGNPQALACHYDKGYLH